MDIELMKEEWKRYNKFKPSSFQKVFWFFFPTMTSMKWKKYKNVNEEECC